MDPKADNKDATFRPQRFGSGNGPLAHILCVQAGPTAPARALSIFYRQQSQMASVFGEIAFQQPQEQNVTQDETGNVEGTAAMQQLPEQNFMQDETGSVAGMTFMYLGTSTEGTNKKKCCCCPCCPKSKPPEGAPPPPATKALVIRETSQYDVYSHAADSGLQYKKDGVELWKQECIKHPDPNEPDVRDADLAAPRKNLVQVVRATIDIQIPAELEQKSWCYCSKLKIRVCPPKPFHGRYVEKVLYVRICPSAKLRVKASWDANALFSKDLHEQDGVPGSVCTRCHNDTEWGSLDRTGGSGGASRKTPEEALRSLEMDTCTLSHCGEAYLLVSATVGDKSRDEWLRIGSLCHSTSGAPVPSFDQSQKDFDLLEWGKQDHFPEKRFDDSNIFCNEHADNWPGYPEARVCFTCE
eukprot:858711-Rhodomonas_salina.1